jgi:serine/threonine-protein kinase
LALLEREFAAAKQALNVMGANGSHYLGLELPRSWSEGVVARAAGDNENALTAFTAARLEVAEKLRESPDYAELLSVLGMIDANLARKTDAIREGKRAIELLPITRDSINGALLLQNLAYIYARTGEKALACDQLVKAAEVPGALSYGELQLNPDWDPLREEPCFQQILNVLGRK